MHPLLVLIAVSALARAKDFECALEDDASSALIGAGKSGAFRTCTYSQAGQCAYSEDGYFSSGDSTCPNTLSAATSQSDIQTICPKTDNGGSNLTGSGVSGEFKTCTYSNAGVCIYFSDGLFSSGGSICPETIVPGPCVCTSGASGISSAGPSPQGDAVLAASNSGDERGSAGGLSPALIALLVLNAVLIVIILILSTMLARARRAAGPSRLKTLYKSIDESKGEFDSP
ncbi:hypothetical protein B0H19DRAFT_1310900 [Mycena capillaripes]|nr:hypothetical protein B0H19DRAFT_1310900 [Mycena capillaripes]